LTAIRDKNGLWLLSAEDSLWVVQSCGKTQLLSLESDVLPLTVESHVGVDFLKLAMVVVDFVGQCSLLMVLRS